MKTSLWKMTARAGMAGLVVLIAYGPAVAGMESHGATVTAAAESTALLERIRQATAAIQTLSADFQSTKTLAFLDEPVKTEGRIAYARDRGIRWEVLQPYRAAMVYNGTHMVQYTAQPDGAWQRQDADSDLLLKEVMKQLQSWLSGAAFNMQAMYAISLVSENPVTVEFIPRSGEMQAVLSKLVFTFGNDLKAVQSLQVVEGTGDTTLIQYENIRLDADLAPELFQ